MVLFLTNSRYLSRISLEHCEDLAESKLDFCLSLMLMDSVKMVWMRPVDQVSEMYRLCYLVVIERKQLFLLGSAPAL